MRPLYVFSKAESWTWVKLRQKGSSLVLSSKAWFLSSGDTHRYWNDYASGLCRHPDVHQTMKKIRIWRMPLTFIFLGLTVLLSLWFSTSPFSFFFFFAAEPRQLSGWRWRLKMEHEEKLQQEIILLVQTVSPEVMESAVKKEVDGVRNIETGPRKPWEGRWLFPGRN